MTLSAELWSKFVAHLREPSDTVNVDVTIWVKSTEKGDGRKATQHRNIAGKITPVMIQTKQSFSILLYKYIWYGFYFKFN